MAIWCLPIAAMALPSWSLTPWTILINTNNIVNVTNTSYGAVGDGVKTNTTAIQAAINAAAAGGTVNGLSGGTVEIPAGVYLCGPITMKSAVNLQIDGGAILRMLPFGQYPMTFTTNVVGTTTNITWSAPTFISGSSLHDVEISGPGAIDGQGTPWWQYPSEGRAVMIGPSSCNRLLIQNITLSNSPMFHIAIGGGRSANTTVQNVTISAPSSSPNTDACDVAGTNILIQNNHISEGDDDFTCGGGTSDVLITNNTYGTGHGISIGSYTDSGGVSNILVINCTMNGAVNGIRLKSDNNRGGVVQNIEYCNIGLTNVNFPIQAYAYYNEVGTPSSITPYYAATQQVASLTSTEPTYRNILYSNINATANSGYPAIILWPRIEVPGTNFVFDRVNISASKPVEVYNFKGVQFIDCQFTLPSSIATFNVFNSQIIVSNSTQSSALQDADGIVTNGYVNSFGLFNGKLSFDNTNVLSGSALTIGSGTLTVSNNLNLSQGSSVLNYYLGTNAATIAVTGNLTLGGTVNVTNGGGFTNVTYTLLTYGQTLSGSAPTLGAFPTGYGGNIDTSSSGAVSLVVTNGSGGSQLPATPVNVAAAGGNDSVTVTWSPVSTATNYIVQRSTSGSGGTYAIIGNTTGTIYDDIEVTNETTYYYEVAAENAGGQSGYSTAVSAMPQAATGNFGDNFGTSTVDSAPAVPTGTATSYEIISSKGWNPTPTIGAGNLQFGIGSTTSGTIEAQALFANTPFPLGYTGDSITLTVTFTDVSGLLTEPGSLGFGLYNSGQNYPVSGGMNGTLSSGSTGNATGNAQNWVGYLGQLSSTGITSQILTRPAQSGANDSSQELLTTGSSSSYVGAATLGTASTSPSVTLAAGNTYTEVLTITMDTPSSLGITNSLYTGTSTNGTLLSQFGGIASGNNFLTSSFDALAIGWRAEANTTPTEMDISQVSISLNTTPISTVSLVPTNVVMQVSNNSLYLSWPPDHLGWELQMQTNTPGTGLGTNWVMVPGSTNVTSTNILIDPTQGDVFLRMAYP
ncbi:MAG TPA: glycosyl hydrolase family 28 protein [Verrucomicrobiae bacterium]